MNKQPPLQIWTVTDGTAGMRFQAIALAEAICTERPNATHSDYVAPPHRLLRSLPQWGRVCSWLPLFAATPVTAAGITAPTTGTYPDILITCGRRMAGVSIAMRERAQRAGKQMQTVHLQDPRLSPSLFDALVVPSHDPTRGENVVVSLGSLNRLSLATIDEAAAHLPSGWLDAPDHAPVAVMLGGDNARYLVGRHMAMHMASELRQFAEHMRISNRPVKLLLVPSRRTPEELVAQLPKLLAGIPHEIATPDMDNPYPGVLAAAAIIVSADSVNMVSEAAITGRPVLIAGWRPDSATSCGGETGRIGTFHRNMIAHNHTAILSPYAEIYGYEALDERAEIAQKTLSLLHV